MAAQPAPEPRAAVGAVPKPAPDVSRVAARAEPNEAAAPEADTGSGTPAAPPDPATLLPELELRKSLDSDEQTGLGVEAGTGDDLADKAAFPIAPPKALTGLQPIREPIAGQACECPYDIAPSGEACDEESEWSTPGGHDPVCYADKWAEGFGANCPLPAASGWEGNAVAGFCPPA